jgi:Flp pilus assembly protein TadG
MIRRFDSLRRDSSGAAAMEFAFAVPLLLTIIIGMLQVGMAFLANAGMRNAVEIATRYATIYPTPTDAQIWAKLQANAFGLGPLSNATSSTVSGCTRYAGDAPGMSDDYTVTICRGTANGEANTEVTMVFPVKLNLFIYSNTINLTYTRRAYRS